MEDKIIAIASFSFLVCFFFYQLYRTEKENRKYYQRELDKEKYITKELLKRTEVKL